MGDVTCFGFLVFFFFSSLRFSSLNIFNLSDSSLYSSELRLGYRANSSYSAKSIEFSSCSAGGRLVSIKIEPMVVANFLKEDVPLSRHLGAITVLGPA